MTKKFYYHNELYFRVPRPIKRRFMEICREKGVKPNDLLFEITKRYVFENTPKDAFSEKIVDIKNWFNRSRRQLYNLYCAVLLMMVGIMFVVTIPKITQSFMFITLFIAFTIIILVFAKVFFILGKNEREVGR